MARAPTKISPPKSLAVRFVRSLTTAPAVSYFSFFLYTEDREHAWGESGETREERGRKLLPFTINLHNFTFSLATHGSERKTTRSRSSSVRLACEISAITPQKKERPCGLLSQMLWILVFLITADPQLTDTLSLSLPSTPTPPLPLLLSLPHTNTAYIFFSRLSLSGHL